MQHLLSPLPQGIGENNVITRKVGDIAFLNVFNIFKQNVALRI